MQLGALPDGRASAPKNDPTANESEDKDSFFTRVYSILDLASRILTPAPDGTITRIAPQLIPN